MVKKTLQSLGNGILRAQNTILSAAAILCLASFVNAILGFLKGRLLASVFGVSSDLSVFYTADKIPSAIYSVLVVGAISTVFIPVFTGLLKKDKDKAWDVASSLMFITVTIFLVAGIVLFIYASGVIRVISLGEFDSSQIILGTHLMRIMLVAQLVLVLSSFVTSALHSFKYFLIPALAPVVYNLGVILGIVFFSGKFGIYGPAFGVVLGSVAHLFIQVPLLKRIHFKVRLRFDLTEPKFKKALALMPPRIVSVLFANAISTVNNALAILVSTPSVVFLRFANQLQFFPVNLFGVSVASALLPTLSYRGSMVEKSPEERKAFKKIFLTSLHQVLFLVVPTSVIFLVLRVPVVRIVYGVSRFPWEATVKTSYTLAFFSISVFAQATNYLLTRAFYALKDMKTPVKVSAATIVLNVLLSVFFVRGLNWGVWAIAFSFSLTSLLDMLLLLFLLSKKLGGFSKESLLIPFTKISYAALFMGVCLYLPLKLLDNYVFDTTRTIGLLILTFVATVFGIVAYLFFTELFKVEEVAILYSLLKRFKWYRKPKLIAEPDSNKALF